MKETDANTTAMELLEPASLEALLPATALWPWLLAAGLIALAVVGLLVFLRKKKPAGDSLAARRIAYQEASAQLEKATAQDVRDAAVRSSLILRQYLSAAAGDPALFETHEEFVARHDSLASLSSDARAAAESGFARLVALKYAAEVPEGDPARVVTDSRALLETLHQGFAA